MHIKRFQAPFAFCLGICLVIMGSTSFITADIYRASVYLNIVNSYYIDLDGDNMEEDIVTCFKLRINIEDYNPKDHPYMIYVQMKLSTGNTFFYEFKVNQNPSALSSIYLYNQTLESGYYTFLITVVVPYAKNEYRTVSDSLVFDPPSGNSGIEPCAALMI
ncbi:hypothetical protein [Candidatus Hodarchaeum mangrovi]